MATPPHDQPPAGRTPTFTNSVARGAETNEQEEFLEREGQKCGASPAASVWIRQVRQSYNPDLLARHTGAVQPGLRMHSTPLDDLLRQHGVSARELQRRGGPDRLTIRRWRRGAVARRPSIQRLAAALGVEYETALSAVLTTAALAQQGGDGC